MKLQLLVLGLIGALNSMAQSQLDSLIQLRKTDFIGGKVPTYYSPGNDAIAKDIQKTISDAIKYFEKKYTKTFNVKLAVLDSTQWLTERVPYGLIFYSDGWIVMNTGMNYKKFADMYGLNAYYADKELEKEKITHNSFVTSVYKFYSIHEMGHYFINELSNAKSPDDWTSEFVPTYLAYEFFNKERKKELRAMEIFSLVSKNHYSPKYSSIESFNEKYTGVGIPNYIWYHSNFYFFVKDLYKCKGSEFFTYFEQTFPKITKRNYTTKEISDLLDKGCAGLATRWLNEMASKENK
jgi:hypothetical protein